MAKQADPQEVVKGLVAIALAAGIYLWFHGDLDRWFDPARKSLPAQTVAAGGAASGDVPAVPPSEAALVRVIEDYAARYAQAPNDMARGALRPERARALCQLQLGVVRDWIGRVETLSSNNEGKGVLGVRLSDHLEVRTTNNDLSDSLGSIHTLIDPDSPLHAQAVALHTGQLVRFSGQIGQGGSDCLEEVSLTASGAMEDPEFLFRFSAVAAAD